MTRSYRPVDRVQRFLLPVDMAEWLPRGHLVWFVLDVVEQLDTAVFHRRHPRAGPGRLAYDPDMLLVVLLYAYAVGERLSRRIERLCETDVAFRVACAQDVPDHATISRFRQVHEDVFIELFTQVLRLCARAGMGRVGTVAIDGTKIAADASLQANRTCEGLRQEVERIVGEAVATDAVEDEWFGQARGDELPVELADPNSRKDRIRRCLQQVQAEQQRAEQASQDQQARAADYLRRVEAGEAPAGMPPDGIDPIRLARARLAREEARLAQAVDKQQRNRAGVGIRRAKRSLARAEAQAAAEDAGAVSREAAKPPGRRGGHGSAGPQKTTRADKQALKAPKANTTDPDSRALPTKRGWIQGYNAQVAVSADHLVLATRLTADADDSKWFESILNDATAAAGHVAAARPPTDDADSTPSDPVKMVLADAGYLSTHNLTIPGPDRLIATGTSREVHRAGRQHPATGPPPQDSGPIEQMRHRLRTPQAQQAYKQRAATVEPAIAHLKDQPGLRQFARRGIKAAASELNLAATAINLLKLHKHTTTAPAT